MEFLLSFSLFQMSQKLLVLSFYIHRYYWHFVTFALREVYRIGYQRCEFLDVRKNSWLINRNLYNLCSERFWSDAENFLAAPFLESLSLQKVFPVVIWHKEPHHMRPSARPSQV